VIYWLALTRFVHISGSILLAAVFAFRLIVFVPATASSHGPATRGVFRGEFGRLFLVGCMMTVICSGLAWFTFVAASIEEDASLLEVRPETAELILFQTQFGHLWLFRLGCCLVLGVLLFTACPESIKALLATVVLASLGWAGHAGAISPRAGPLALVGDVGHLIAAALWPGGLVPLLFFLYAESRAADGGDWSLAARVTRRFSTVSLAAVAFLATTGILNACFLVGNLRAVFGTDYGRLLLVKIGLFLLTITIGAWNLLVLKPDVVRLAPTLKKGKPPRPIALLIRNVICETGLAACLLLVVGFLGLTPTPRH
jgi:copper resistance protein D